MTPSAESGTPEYDAGMTALTQWTFALLTMRANTPGGEWLSDDFQEIYQDGLRESIETLGESEAGEYALLDLMNMADWLLMNLSVMSGRPKDYWLGELRKEYVDPEVEGA
jgi:hypothetical protein